MTVGDHSIPGGGVAGQQIATAAGKHGGRVLAFYLAISAQCAPVLNGY